MRVIVGFMRTFLSLNWENYTYGVLGFGDLVLRSRFKH